MGVKLTKKHFRFSSQKYGAADAAALAAKTSGGAQEDVGAAIGAGTQQAVFGKNNTAGGAPAAAASPAARPGRPAGMPPTPSPTAVTLCGVLASLPACQPGGVGAGALEIERHRYSLSPVKVEINPSWT